MGNPLPLAPIFKLHSPISIPSVLRHSGRTAGPPFPVPAALHRIESDDASVAHTYGAPLNVPLNLHLAATPPPPACCAAAKATRGMLGEARSRA